MVMLLLLVIWRIDKMASLRNIKDFRFGGGQKAENEWQII
jgi:hypothetical protein